MARHRASVDVALKPVFGNGAVCEVRAANNGSRRYVRGGVVKLRGSPSYDVNFQLPAGYQFDRNHPIWSSKQGCPSGIIHDGQITNPVVDASGTILTVQVDPQNAPNAVHVSLGFNNGVRCDPIIINQ